MTPEEKQLLFKDLCARLSYGVKVHTWYNKPIDIKCTGVDVYTNVVNLDIPEDDAKVYIDNVKPYLRPMSSMTEEEKNECSSIFTNSMYQFVVDEYGDVESTKETPEREKIYYNVELAEEWLSWLNAHHFDYRGLIEKGLAFEAPEGMYKTE